MRDLEKYLARCEKILTQLQIPFRHPDEILPNTRAKKRWGQCVWTPWGVSININAILLRPDVPADALKTTILHELLHTVPGCRNHGDRWKQYAQIVSKATGLNIRRTNDLAREYGFERLCQAQTSEKTYRYLVRCDQCGTSSRYQRAGKVVVHPERYRCSHCGGTLSVFSVKPD